jgi:hypothetical protein
MVQEEQGLHSAAAHGVTVNGAHTTQPSVLMATMQPGTAGVTAHQQEVVQATASCKVVDVVLPPLCDKYATQSKYDTSGEATHRTQEGVRLFPTRNPKTRFPVTAITLGKTIAETPRDKLHPGKYFTGVPTTASKRGREDKVKLHVFVSTCGH